MFPSMSSPLTVDGSCLTLATPIIFVTFLPSWAPAAAAVAVVLSSPLSAVGGAAVTGSCLALRVVFTSSSTPCERENHSGEAAVRLLHAIK